MRGVISYLNSSELVSDFQRACGLVPVRAGDSGARAKNEQQEQEQEQQEQQRRRHHGEVAANGDLNHNRANRHQNGHLKPHYEVKNWTLYFLFVVSATLGNEVFYISFLPCIHWNLDPFLCRRLVNIWAVVMYIGQVMKDVLKLPRPTMPPVVKLEHRVDAEYGMPSTHAMAATAISFTLLLSAQERVQFPFEVGLLIAVVLSTLVGLSRLYTGMHFALDVICGTFISAAILGISYPFWQTLDHLQLNSPFSPIIALLLPLYLCYKYPELDHYSTTRGDTTIIMGVSAGCSMGYWINNQLGQTFEPAGPFPVPPPSLNLFGFGLGVARFCVGLLLLVLTRQIMRWATLRLFCWYYGAAPSDINARRRKEIEVPYKFSTYTTMGLVNSVLVCRVFIKMGLL